MKNKVKLSDQELIVLKCLKLGMKSRAIAEYMMVSQKTIGTYIARIRQKARIEPYQNLYSMILTCIELGYLKPEKQK